MQRNPGDCEIREAFAEGQEKESVKLKLNAINSIVWIYRRLYFVLLSLRSIGYSLFFEFFIRHLSSTSTLATPLESSDSLEHNNPPNMYFVGCVQLQFMCARVSVSVCCQGAQSANCLKKLVFWQLSKSDSFRSKKRTVDMLVWNIVDTRRAQRRGMSVQTTNDDNGNCRLWFLVCSYKSKHMLSNEMACNHSTARNPSHNTTPVRTN